MKSKNRPLSFSDPVFPGDAPPPLSPLDDKAPEAPIMPMEPLGSGGAPAQTGARSVTAFEPATRKTAPAPAPGGARFTYLLALAATVLWIGGLVAFTLGYRSHLGPFEDEPFAAVVLAVLALAPVGLVWIGAFALKQGARLLAEAARLQSLSEQMAAPAVLAAAEAGSAVDAIRMEIDSAAAAAAQARDQLLQLRQALSDETDRLVEMASGSARDASALVQSLGRERSEFSVLSGKLDSQSGQIAEAIARHARMVAEASDLAQTQVHEAEAALSARAADLAAAAGEATEAARMAGDDLARQAARLEAAGVTVGEQVQVVEEGLGQQRAALVSLGHALRAEQEDLAVHFESQRAQLTEMLRQSEQGVMQVGDAANHGAETLRQLIAHAVDQLQAMGDQAQTERDLIGGAALQSLGAFSEAAAFERRALEEETRRAIDELAAAAEAAHKAAETSSAAARLKVEQLSESAFAAGQTADAAFEKRLSEARGLIERSAQLVEEAGARSAQKLDQGVQAAGSALESLQDSLAAIEARSARLPADARTRGDEVKAALESATEALLGSARTAADELQSIDSAFQERVRRNYEMLSEAVRLMGVLGGGAATRAGGGLPLHPRPAPLSPAPRRGPTAPEAQPDDDLGLRPRLKLTPTASDEEFRTVFDPPPQPSAHGPVDGEAWTWKELLSGLDESQADDVELERTLVAEIDALGIDALALMPALRLEDIAAALRAGDPGGAREIVHRLAPAAIRKLGRQVLSDKLLRVQADRFVGRYGGVVRDDARRGGAKLSQLLASPPGRAYLLLDAAVGDI